jgi:arginase
MGMPVSRRDWIHQVLTGSLFAMLAQSRERDDRKISLIAAPTNLGLRPGPGGEIPGTWKMPEVLLEAGLAQALRAVRVDAVSRRAYDEHAQQGTRIRNGQGIRTFSLELARKVSAALHASEFPVVLGGDCSVLLGCLLGTRWAGGRGLVHVDGHSDFFHPGNYDSAKRLGSAAGMDLALATGRGEPLLTQWPKVEGPLVADEDAVQIGERDAEDPEYVVAGYGDIVQTAIARITIQRVRGMGLDGVVEQVRARLDQRDLTRMWLHVDLDVLDQSELPAVDSPGSPGLTASELSQLLYALISTQRVVGVDFAIYDPDLDPQRRYPRMLVECLANSIAGRRESRH